MCLGAVRDRHGESEHNTQSDWGIRDPGLTAIGWKQVPFFLLQTHMLEHIRSVETTF